MDTPYEIAVDEFHEKYKGCCGTCWFHSKTSGHYYCDNEESEAYGEPTEHGEGCACYREEDIKRHFKHSKFK